VVFTLSGLLKKSDSCFDRLSTNGKSPTTSSLPPFALSLSKGERGVFQHPVSGHIEGDQVAELQRLFTLEADGVSLVLDLHEVELLDREAVRFLARCEAEGTTLAHCPAYIREWVVRERAQL